MKISPGLPLSCGDVTISSTRDLAHNQPECIGVYSPTEMFSAGKRVFKHVSQERYLLSQHGKVNWYVQERLDKMGALMSSGCAPSLCPADPRAMRSQRSRVTSWKYSDGEERMVQGRDITVKCSVHAYCDTQLGDPGIQLGALPWNADRGITFTVYINSEGNVIM